jgi:tetratricopeptide (TPR) repeat protein
MEASIAAIASTDEDARAAGVETSSASVLPWLASRKQNWFMIFDGADGRYAEVEAFIPAGKGGNILISSRNSDMQRLASPLDAFIIVIELDQDAAIALFFKSARLSRPTPSEKAHSEAIVQELCCLPLAVDQAATAIASGLCRVDEYLDTYKRHRLRLMDNLTFEGSSNYGRAVYTTWDISLAELERRANARASDSTAYAAAILLRIFSFFHFDGIREDTFRRAAKTQDERLPTLPSDSQLLLLLQRTEDNDWDFLNFRQAISILSMFSLVHSTGSGTYFMHRLVHQWMQDRLPESHRSAIALLAADVLVRSEGYGGSSDDYAHRRALLVHLITLTARLRQNDFMHQLSADALERMGWIYRSGGKPVDAEALLRQAIFSLKERDSGATEQYMNITASLAAALGKSGKLREAEDLFRCVLEWQELYFGTDHLATARTRCNLALTLYRLGQHRVAKERLLQVLGWQRKHLHPDTYLTMAILGNILRELGELAEARRLEVKVLKWQKAHLGMDHPDTYLTMGNLARTLCELGDLTEARTLQMQVLKWQKEHLGMDHPDTYQIMGNLANTLCGLGKRAEAKELEIQVLAWRKAYLGMDHPDTYQIMSGLAHTLRGLGELAEAKELEMQVLEWRRVYLGMDHPDTYLIMGNLAITLHELGELPKVKVLEVQVLEWRKTRLGMDHPHTYRGMGNLAKTLCELGELAEAKGLEMQVLIWRKEHLGLKHKDTFHAMKSLAWTLEELGEITEAEELRAQVAELQDVSDSLVAK